jgi:hypothetical protein
VSHPQREAIWAGPKCLLSLKNKSEFSLLQRTTVTVTEGFDTADLQEGQSAARRALLKLAASGYELPVEADEGPSALQSRTGRSEAGAGTGGRPVRQEQAQGILVAALGMLAAQSRYALAG